MPARKPQRPACRETTAAGTPCRNRAAAGSAYCSSHGGGRRAAHRPTKLNTATADTILEHVRTGATLEIAAQAAGINRTTLNKWRERGEDDRDHGRTTPYASFVDAFTRALAEGETSLIDAIRSAATKGKYRDWRAAAWLLERRHRERWARRAGEDAIDPEALERAKPRDVAPVESARDTILGLLAAATRPPAGGPNP